ncbi:MAG: zeta toxin family protein [Elstera cyanobacteriorum]|nr:zeta toxin family protein [Elstera cyanobacteriorum]
MIAGPNGAGKTTFARAFLPNEANCPRFINADLIAAGLSPFAPEKVALRAGRLMLEEIDRAFAAREDFAIETTLSGLGYLKQIAAWRAAGYRVSLYFLSLPTADQAVARVRLRVRQGGHSIPEDVIGRRFTAGFQNFTDHYRLAVDWWILYDTSTYEPNIIDISKKSNDLSKLLGTEAVERASKFAKKLFLQQESEEL